jgi:ferredoxin
MTQVLARETLLRAVGSWLEQGWKVGGPRRVGTSPVQYGWLDAAADLLLTGFVRPANSIKCFFLPRHETLFAFRGRGKDVTLHDTASELPPQVIVGARPCDAAALPTLDRVFHCDTPDRLFQQRRARSTVITIACTHHDEYCFCTSVGLGPASTDGSDVLLVPAGTDQFEVRYATDRGRELLEPWVAQAEVWGSCCTGPEVRFSLSGLQATLQHGGDESRWNLATLACVGCGACAHSCPACHCFDIVDQARGGGGRRVRNWDSCQSVMYSMHASGHNPRHLQAVRQRNRIRHKFQYYPQKFDRLLCTGCGACSRNCPVSLGVLPLLVSLANSPQTRPGQVLQHVAADGVAADHRAVKTRT